LTNEKIAVVKLQGDEGGDEIIRRFNNQIKKNTGTDKTIVNTYTVSTKEPNYDKVVEGLIADEVTCVLITMDNLHTLDFFKKAKEKEFFGPTFLGTKQWDDESFLSELNSLGLFKIAFSENAQVTEVDSEESASFHDVYHAKYGEDADPSLACATAYDSYMIVIAAIESAYADVSTWNIDEVVKDMTDANQKATRQSYDKMMEEKFPDGVRIREAICNISDYQGASGSISYNGNNDCVKTINVIYMIAGTEAGKFVW